MVTGLFTSTRWISQRAEALREFDDGRRSVADGQITEGYNRMRSSIDRLPFGETFYRDYFIRSVAALGANLSPEVARLAHSSQILAATASADGRYVLLGDDAGNTTLWDLAAKTTFSLPIRPGRKPISAIAFNQSSSLCASGDIDGEVTVWDVHSRQVIWRSHLDYRVIFLGFLGGGSRLLTGNLERTGPKTRKGSRIRMWDVLHDGGKELLVESEDLRSEGASDLVVSPVGDRFVSICLSGRSLLWDSDTGRVLADVSGDAVTVTPPENPTRLYAGFSADGSRLAVAGSRLTIHNGRTGEVVRSVDACRGERVHCVAFRDDGGASLVVGTGRAAAVRCVTPDLEVWDDVPIDRPINPNDIAAFTGRGLILTGRTTRTLRLFQPPPLSLPHADLGADTLAHKGHCFRRWLPHRHSEPPESRARWACGPDDGGNDRCQDAIASVGRPYAAAHQPDRRTTGRPQCGGDCLWPGGRQTRCRLHAARG